MKQGQSRSSRQREAAFSESQAGWRQAANLKNKFLLCAVVCVSDWRSEGNLWELVSGVLLQSRKAD